MVPERLLVTVAVKSEVKGVVPLAGLAVKATLKLVAVRFTEQVAVVLLLETVTDLVPEPKLA